VTGGPRLNWGLLPAFDPDRGGRVPRDLTRAWQVAGESLDLVVRPIERFELAGTLNGHPGHVRSDEAKKDFPGIFALAVTGFRGQEPLRSRSRAAAASALLSWAQVYRPSGNPVDERFFAPLLQAADLVAGYLGPGDRAALLGWVRDFAACGDRFYASLNARNTTWVNNWMAMRLLVRSVATTVTGDAAARAATPGLLREFTARNFVAGPDGERDGRTYDFMQRDALHYHVADLQPLVEMTLYTPDLVDAGARTAIGSGLEFLRPYFLGERQHVEFARTTIAFDRERRDDGNPEFANAPWNPARGRVLLRLARASFPQVRPWTEQIVDPSYDPRTKLLAAIYGEPQRRAEWRWRVRDSGPRLGGRDLSQGSAARAVGRAARRRPEPGQQRVARRRAQRVDQGEHRLPGQPLAMLGNQERAAAPGRHQRGGRPQRQFPGQAAGRRGARAEPVEFFPQRRQLGVQRRRAQHPAAPGRDAQRERGMDPQHLRGRSLGDRVPPGHAPRVHVQPVEPDPHRCRSVQYCELEWLGVQPRALGRVDEEPHDLVAGPRRRVQDVDPAPAGDER